MSTESAKIDSLANDAVVKALPRLRGVCGKDGRVVYNKAFGYTNYDNKAVNINIL